MNERKKNILMLKKILVLALLFSKLLNHNYRPKQRGFSKKELKLNLCNLFSILTFNDFLFICLLTLKQVKLGHTVTIEIYLPPLIWNKITFLVSNSLNFPKLVENELWVSPKKLTNIPFSSQFIAGFVKILRAYN